MEHEQEQEEKLEQELEQEEGKELDYCCRLAVFA